MNDRCIGSKLTPPSGNPGAGCLQSNDSSSDLFDEEPVIPSNYLTRRRLSLEFAERRTELSDAARQLRATMPDQTRRVLNAVFERADEKSSISSSTPALSSQLTSQVTSDKSQTQKPPEGSPKVSRRYSQPQNNIDNVSQGSSVDNEVLLETFQRSVGVLKSPALRAIERRRSSPELLIPPHLSTQTASDIPGTNSILPEQSILGKMVGSRKQTSFFSSFMQQNSDSSSSSSVVLSSSQSNKENTDQNNQIVQGGGGSKCQRIHTSELETVEKPSDSVDSASSGFGLFAKTRQFGAWLSSSVDGEKVEVTKKDLNVFAPTTF